MAMKDISDKQVCEAYVEAIRKRQDEKECVFPYEILMKVTGQPEKVCYRAMERASDRDYVEYGVSLRTGWLTEKGRKLLDG